MFKFPNKVVVCGLTHGNEWIGKYILDYLQNKEIARQFSNLSIEFIYSNPEAFKLNRRYVDQDLNRSFGSLNPATKDRETGKAIETTRFYEEARSLEIEAQIDKLGREEVFILDIHSTTAGMGRSIVMHDINPSNVSVVSFLKNSFDDVNAYAWIEKNNPLNFLNSLSPYGFAVEIGPIPPSTINYASFKHGLDTVLKTLEFLNAPEKNMSYVADQACIYVHERNVDYPRDENGEITAVPAPSLANSQFKALKHEAEIFTDFDGNTTTNAAFDGLYPVFVNEAAYYEKGIAFSLTDKRSYPTLKMSRET